jgi:hypothetical protein
MGSMSAALAYVEMLVEQSREEARRAALPVTDDDPPSLIKQDGDPNRLATAILGRPLDQSVRGIVRVGVDYDTMTAVARTIEGKVLRWRLVDRARWERLA